MQAGGQPVGVALDHVVSDAASDEVIAAFAKDDVVAAAAINTVVAATGIDKVIAAAAVDVVIAPYGGFLMVEFGKFGAVGILGYGDIPLFGCRHDTVVRQDNVIAPTADQQVVSATAKQGIVAV